MRFQSLFKSYFDTIMRCEHLNERIISAAILCVKPNADKLTQSSTKQFSAFHQCGGGRISMPYFGATISSFCMSAGVTGSGGESNDGSGCANSAMKFSKPGGVTRINIRAGALPSFLKAWGIPRGP